MAMIQTFKVGDTVKVSQKIIEGKKERVTVFKGEVVKVKGSKENKMFIVRHNFDGVDVDRIFPLESPVLKIEYVSSPKKRVRKANILKVKTKK